MKFQPLLLMLVALVAVAGPMAGAVERPNIVFVLFDDFGWGQPPSNRGDSPFKTPSFDGLAREGMRFTDAIPRRPTARRPGMVSSLAVTRPGSDNSASSTPIPLRSSPGNG